MSEVQSVPSHVLKHLTVILRFLSGFVANSSNKFVFNSVEELIDLLAAADDSIADLALEVLSLLATPPALHKQQVPELQQHASALHNSRTTSYKRLVAMAKGWGTRGSGLGLFTCATADDSDFGQGSLPKDPGELRFAFYKERRPSHDGEEKKSEDEESPMTEIILSKSD
eukprot:CAMPEP_0176157920 /NCGR_PEP_ID=MMETSP0120_2-20121206/80750_1 /TAXON_ID=160619 /ORGANISM="Kryptoperidinium foliaceum, Strain CCMP 1326" /LENGTH=169 /DNA_ID=CAMNT_0017495233 /DNA_START=98 /DNA_END=604 /DNA_ORIENTATION=+